MPPRPEERARETIDRQLAAAGWLVQDSKAMNLYAGRGAGRLVSQVVLPLGICFVIQRTGTLQPIHIWLAILAGHAARFSLSFAPFRQGRWRAIAVDIRPAVQQESA